LYFGWFDCATTLGYDVPVTELLSLNLAAGLNLTKNENYNKYITNDNDAWRYLVAEGIVDEETTIGGLKNSSTEDSFNNTPVFLRIGLGLNL